MNTTGNGAPSEGTTEELRELSQISPKEQNSQVEFRVINGNGMKEKIKYPCFGERVRAIAGIDIKIVNEPQSADEQALIRALTEDDSADDDNRAVDLEDLAYQKIRDRLVKILLDES